MLKALIKTMRPRQWPKNAFILAAVIFDRQLSISNPEPLIRSLIGVLLFCLLSSAVYIINDLADIEADRMHPTKRFRPIPSGKLSVQVAIAAAAFLVLFTLVSAAFLSMGFFVVSVIYFLMNIAYSNWLKHIPLVDVLILAAGFVLRVGAGVTIIHVQRFSPWLYVVTTLLALYIGFGKRRAEITLLADGANSHRKVLDGYNLSLLDQLITVVSSCTILGLQSLYLLSPQSANRSQHDADHSIRVIWRFPLFIPDPRKARRGCARRITADRPASSGDYSALRSVYPHHFLCPPSL